MNINCLNVKSIAGLYSGLDAQMHAINEHERLIARSREALIHAGLYSEDRFSTLVRQAKKESTETAQSFEQCLPRIISECVKGSPERPTATQKLHDKMMQYVTENNGEYPAAVHMSRPLLNQIREENKIPEAAWKCAASPRSRLCGVPVYEFESQELEFSFSKEVNKIV